MVGMPAVKVEVPSYYFAIFPENYMKIKEIGPKEEGRLSRPLEAANGNSIILFKCTHSACRRAQIGCG